MTESYIIRREGDLLRVGFGAPARNDQVVRDAVRRLREMDAGGELDGGGLIRVNGPASLPVVVAIAHALLHKFAAIGIFDPKLNAYVVAASHDPEYAIGDLID